MRRGRGAFSTEGTNMPLRNTLADALAPTSGICAALGVFTPDERVIGWINAASGRLFISGPWIGTIEKATIQVTNQLLTLPAEFATAEQIAIGCEPVDLRTPWAEFDPNGFGVINDPEPGTDNRMWFRESGALRRNSACTFQDIPKSAPSKLTLQCDVAADVGLKVTVLGFDNATPPNWVRTQVNGAWQDGEVIALSQSPGTISNTTFSKITGIQFPSGRSGQSWLYASDGTMIGHYQYWETYPSYQRYLLPFLALNQPAQVDILGKRNFRPVSQPTDWLPIPNLEALRLGCMAVKRESENLFKEAAVFMNGVVDRRTGQVVQDGAITILDKELRHFTGGGEVAAFRTFGAVGPAGEPIEAFL